MSHRMTSAEKIEKSFRNAYGVNMKFWHGENEDAATYGWHDEEGSFYGETVTDAIDNIQKDAQALK